MLNKKEILSEIKKLMKFGAEEVQNFIDAKSGENIVRVEGEDFTVGADIMLVTPEGLLPAPDGEHLLDDGRMLTVSGGKITEIELPEMEVETPEVEVELAEENITPEEAAGEKESAMKKMEDAEKKIEEMEKKIMDMEEIVKEMVKAYGSVNKFTEEVSSKIDNFIQGTPADLEFKSLKSEYKEVVKKGKEVKLSSLDKIKEMRRK